MSGADTRPPEGRAEGPAEGTFRVEVVLKGSLAARLPGGRGPLVLAEGASVSNLLGLLGLPDTPCVFVVNGSAVSRDTLLRDGDRVQIYPPMAGG